MMNFKENNQASQKANEPTDTVTAIDYDKAFNNN